MNIKDAIFGAQSLQKLAAASDDLQGSLPIADIDRGIIYTRDGGLVGLFEVLPMNFFLQSSMRIVDRIFCQSFFNGRLHLPHGSRSHRAVCRFSGSRSRSMLNSTRGVCINMPQTRQMQAAVRVSKTISNRSAA